MAASSCLWLVLSGADSSAQDATWLMESPKQTLTAGEPAGVWLYCLNHSTNAVAETFPAAFDGTTTAGTNTIKIVLRQKDSDPAQTTTIAPGSFARREYTFTMPAGISGSCVLTTENFNPITLPTGATAPATSETTVAAQSAPANSSQTPANSGPKDKDSNTDDTFLGHHLSAYEPIYFLLGTYPAAEFQFSLKFRLLAINGRWNPFGHIYFAYTQTSFWDLISQDPSFYDTSYKPSGFLFYTNLNNGDRFQLDLQGGIEHESNGRGGAMERSLNTIYLQPTAKFDLAKDLELSLQPRVWEYISVGKNNPDLAHYRGYADLRTMLDWKADNGDKIMEFAVRLRLGDHGSHAGWLFDLRYNLPLSWKFNPALDLQYFTGYGQTLRQYDEHSSGFRAGLCLVY